MKLLIRGYRLALLAYPARFRREMGADMTDLFLDLCERERVSHGRRGVVRLFCRTLLEVTRNGLAERLRSNDRRRGRTPAPRVHRQRGDAFVSRIVADVRFAIRAMGRQPVFTGTVVAMLALGIAGVSAIFSVFNALFLRPLPFPEANRLVNLDETAPQWNLEFVSVRYADFHGWRAENQTFESMAAWDETSYNMLIDGEPLRATAALVTHDIMDVLRIGPQLGRAFTEAEDQPGGGRVALLSSNLWRSRFGGSDDVLGNVVNLNGEPYTVVGVLPPEAAFIGDVDLWTPLADNPSDDGSWYLEGIGRLRDGVMVEDARRDLEAVHRALVEAGTSNEATSPTVLPVLERYLGDFRLGTTALLGAVALVLLIACANIAGIMLARSSDRAREMGIRIALGAAGRRLVQQLFTEATLLAAAGAVVGVLLGWGAVRVMVASTPADIPSWIRFEPDLRFAAFAVLVSIGAAVAFGLLPAIHAARPDVQQALQLSAGRSTAGAGKRRLLSTLVVGELALAMVLLIGAGLFMQGFNRLTNVEPGFDPDNVLTYRLALPTERYDAAAQVAFFEEHLDRLRALPGVSGAAAVDNAPLGGHSGYFVEVEGAPPRAEDEPNPVVLVRVATPGYLDAMGVTLMRGRDLSDFDGRAEDQSAMVVNETFVATFLAGEEPIGRRVRLGNSWIPIVGVTRDVQHYGLHRPMRPGIYLPHRQAQRSSLTLVVRASVEPTGVVSQARAVLREQDPSLPMFQITTMAETLEESLWNRRAASWLFAVFAAIALVMATVGIYGVISYAVTQRRHEIGIRMALGARQQSVVWQILRQGLTLLGIAVVVGLPGAWFVARAMAGQVYGVRVIEPLVYAGVVLVLVTVAVLANLLPARRAATIDPIKVLRSE
jgi:putative ABC transport system permease protein